MLKLALSCSPFIQAAVALPPLSAFSTTMAFYVLSPLYYQLWRNQEVLILRKRPGPFIRLSNRYLLALYKIFISMLLMKKLKTFFRH